MGTRASHGFTIIEVMLFLAVTGALTVAVMVGAGVSISQQRYRDSVNTLKSFVQTQFNETTNVVNDRAQNWTCSGAGAVTETPVGGGEVRGTSNCVVLGRLVTIDATGKLLKASNVIGSRTAGAPVGTNDIAELANYAITVSPIGQEESEVSWGAQVVQPRTTTPQSISLLVLLSPLSGSVVTFTADGDRTNNVATMINVNNRGERSLCVNPDAGVFTGSKRLEVRIGAYATNQGAVLIPLETESVCD